MRFSKPATTHDEQIDLLGSRGLLIQDRDRARHYLRHLNYYRLGAYWLSLEQEQDHGTHRFFPGTSFDDVLNLYIFERELRLLALDAIERVEVSVHTQWAYHLAHRYGCHANHNADIFKSEWDHTRNLAKLTDEVSRSQETFIQHLRRKYDEPLPPVCALVEVMSLGQLSKWYSNLRHSQDLNAIAHVFDLDEELLVSFLHHLTTVRNLCAHHSRLWNREFIFTFKLPKGRPAPLLPSVNRQEPRKLYNTLAVMAYLLDFVSESHHWKVRLHGLIAKHRIESRAMGFPAGWENLPLWREGAER